MTIILSSEAYGDETFSYETVREALAGVERLVRAARKEYRKDHIPREIKILIPPSTNT
jgi:hypothetical protein